METAFTFDKYPFLKELGLSQSNSGCWDGENWTGSGKTFHSINPSTNEVLHFLHIRMAVDLITIDIKMYNEYLLLFNLRSLLK
jgi:hypothetical protein